MSRSHNTGGARPAMKKCRACASDIPLSATFCKECNSHQGKFRSNLTFVAGVSGIIGAIAIVFSGFTFVVSNINEVRKAFYPRNSISVVSVDAFEGGISANFINNGDVSVLLEKFQFQWKNEKSSIKIDKIVDAGKFFHSEAGKYPDLEYFASSASEEEKQEILGGASFRPDSCARPFFFDDNDVNAAMVKQHYEAAGRKLVTDDGSAVLYAIRSDTGERFSQEIHVKVGFTKSGSCS